MSATSLRSVTLLKRLLQPELNQLRPFCEISFRLLWVRPHLHGQRYSADLFDVSLPAVSKRVPCSGFHDSLFDRFQTKKTINITKPINSLANRWSVTLGVVIRRVVIVQEDFNLKRAHGKFLVDSSTPSSSVNPAHRATTIRTMILQMLPTSPRPSVIGTKSKGCFLLKNMCSISFT